MIELPVATTVRNSAISNSATVLPVTVLSAVFQAVVSSAAEGVQVPYSCGESPGADLAAWLGSMPRLLGSADSLDEPSAAAGPAPAPTHGKYIEENRERWDNKCPVSATPSGRHYYERSAKRRASSSVV